MLYGIIRSYVGKHLSVIFALNTNILKHCLTKQKSNKSDQNLQQYFLLLGRQKPQPNFSWLLEEVS